MIYLLKVLNFFLAGFSCLGLLLFLKKERKIGISLISILILCLIWRSFSQYVSYRYYVVFILYGLFFSAYAIARLRGVFQNELIFKGVFLLLLVVIFGSHTAKILSSFRNNYILDLQDGVRSAVACDPSNVIYIHKKEFARLWGDERKTDEQVRILSYSNKYDINEVFLRDCHYTNSAYFFVSEKNNSPATSLEKVVFKASNLLRSKVWHLVTNTKHSNIFSVYKFQLNPFPSPEVDLSTVYSDPVLKAYVPEYDAFIYQAKKKMIWLIGVDFDSETEIIYHQLTDRPDLLPKNRIEDGFDNRGFRSGDKSKRKQIGRYFVFEKSIPSEYPITAIRAGFSANNIRYWRIFHLTPY